MEIKSNLNRLHKYHDNVNYEPIELQIFNYIKSTRLFDSVEYKTKGNDQYFILNGTCVLVLRFDSYEFFLSTRDKYKLLCGENTWSEIKYSSEYNKHNSKADNFFQTIIRLIDLNKKADEIIQTFIPEGVKNEELVTKINENLDKYFKNDLIKPRFSLFPENLIGKDNEYTKGIWSWLHFEIIGVKQEDFSNYNKSVGVELFVDGTIKKPRIDEFVNKIQNKNEKLSIKELNSRLKNVGDLEKKINSFNGLKIPVLKDYLTTMKKGYDFRKSIK